MNQFQINKFGTGRVHVIWVEAKLFAFGNGGTGLGYIYLNILYSMNTF